MTSGRGIRLLTPKGAIEPTGTWSLGARAGDFVYVAGMRGIDPASNKLVDGDEARIRQAFLNMKLIAESEGARFIDCVCRLRDRHGSVASSGQQGAGNFVGRRALSAPHDP